MASLNLQGLRKAYGETVIVADLSLQIDAGQLVALVGPSGCGKSTLLRMIAGLLEPSAGSISIDGRDVTRAAPSERDIAMVFQSYALYPHMTVAENIGFPLLVRRVAADERARRVREVAETLGLADLLQRTPRDLSGGQRQRVAMGRAVVRAPKVFLFDEPLSNLDAALRARMRGEIAALHKRLGTTTVYVTHDQHEAMTLADRLVLLNGGRIEQEGPPLAVYAAPQSRFAGEFLGSPGMSFLPARGTGGSFTCGDLVGRSKDAALSLPSDLWLGVRPESFTLREPAADGTCLVAVADWVERTGSDTFVYARLAGADASPFVVKLGRDTPISPGARLGLETHAARLFARDSGRFVAEVA